MTNLVIRGPVYFEEGLGHHFVKCIGYRAPRRGEYYLAGAIMRAYRAVEDMTTHFHIVMPTRKAHLPKGSWRKTT